MQDAADLDMAAAALRMDTQVSSEAATAAIESAARLLEGAAQRIRDEEAAVVAVQRLRMLLDSTYMASASHAVRQPIIAAINALVGI